MILLIDNYDSFTFNLYQYLGMLGQEVLVKRNDKISIAEIKELNPSKILLSPGPGRPEKAGNLLDIIEHFHQSTPILGICLGHQAIAQAMGGKIVHAPELFHGKSSIITHDGKGVFQGLEEKQEVMRYHSLVVEKESLPDFMSITSSTDTGLIMGVRHHQYPLEGIQFHPESILTPAGMEMLKNFTQS